MSIEDFVSEGSARKNAMTPCALSAAKVWPAAFATARFSLSSLCRKANVSGFPRTAPIGLRARQVDPENATSATNFSHRVCSMSSVATASSPIARRHDATKAAMTGSAARPSTTMRWAPPGAWITPGSRMRALR